MKIHLTILQRIILLLSCVWLAHIIATAPRYEMIPYGKAHVSSYRDNELLEPVETGFQILVWFVCSASAFLILAPLNKKTTGK